MGDGRPPPPPTWIPAPPAPTAAANLHHENVHQAYGGPSRPPPYGNPPYLASVGMPHGTNGADALAPLAQGAMAMYGDRLISGGQDFVKKRMGFFSGSMFHYYFHVDMRYVRRKLKIVVAPYLHRGSWTRIPDPVSGEGAYKSPQQDANAPDLYIPIMSFFTYLVLCSFALMRQARLNPDAVSYCLWTSMAAWALQVLLLKAQLFVMSSHSMPLKIAWLDLVCYGGYAFTQVALQQFAALFSKHVYWTMVGYGTLCTGMFLIKTLKRIVFAEARNQGRDFDPKRHNYTLLLLALVQLPLSVYLGVTG